MVLASRFGFESFALSYPILVKSYKVCKMASIVRKGKLPPHRLASGFSSSSTTSFTSYIYPKTNPSSRIRSPRLRGVLFILQAKTSHSLSIPALPD
ncbi:hypothetical protein PGTUg99_016387 [Puccinia graminis f. sp. tritici]|uniref:Uncharacterized protein n=1 Tax=Puccinia graminis f. sp. tritici TaxID=56615 RepID=A0A5B0RD93_PUCGR|nr:hypothetical protein PGTUg99_016387 [Puccinia graminis f. sp. tritici]